MTKKGNFVREDITVIKNPFKTGACDECIYHYIGNYGKDTCSKNHIGILSRTCSKIPECKFFTRNYSAGAAKIKD